MKAKEYVRVKLPEALSPKAAQQLSAKELARAQFLKKVLLLLLKLRQIKASARRLPRNTKAQIDAALAIKLAEFVADEDAMRRLLDELVNLLEYAAQKLKEEELMQAIALTRRLMRYLEYCKLKSLVPAVNVAKIHQLLVLA